MADVVEAGIVRPKKGRRIMKLGLAIVILATLGAGGVVAGYFAANGFDTAPPFREELNKPKLVPKEGQAVGMTLADLTGDKQTTRFKESAFKATYYPIEGPFTTNLKDSNSFAQLSLSVATYYDAQVLDNIEEHETAIRSAILLLIAEQDLATLGTQQGKQALQKLLTDAINRVLKKKTGFGGVNNVYFTSFVVQ